MASHDTVTGDRMLGSLPLPANCPGSDLGAAPGRPGSARPGTARLDRHLELQALQAGPVEARVEVGTTGPNPLELILVVAPFVLPVAAAIYLGLRLRRNTGAQAITG